ncbi:Tripeptidyl aminopeptidase [Streptomyces sp. RB5]|uniref:Tripeptidyl aminopeptidase n=1 Tax=Streptomyces smaragdinus TaxID=2585196 RepID=A0A7K0CKQ3_9ACTN|nr:alpha/beta fold hydrolase [Streptomyces smaragdinus]MQY14079.1 Tripeptidyl aminopeptidase [Streptomyces smaragdinus]
MRIRKRVAAVAVGLAMGTTGVTATGTAAAQEGLSVDWHACPQYSDAVLEQLQIRPEDREAFRALWARTECGTVRVPLDYRRPAGRQLDIAITRLKATDRSHSLGPMFMNPGGPGGSGYLMPAQLVLENPTNASLNEHYDLIGFDPRGIGYSTSYDCPAPEGDPGPQEPPSGPLTKTALRRMYDATATHNAACSASNPAFLRGLTTANAARDLNTVRRALHAPRAAYFGASWGTQLGAVYRSMFPATISRMWLDSVVSPRAYDFSYRFPGSARATEEGARLFTSWLASRDSVYGLGDTPSEVESAILALREAADAHPWEFSDIPQPLDGSFVAFLASAPDLAWDQAGTALHALTTATPGGPAPQEIKDLIAPPQDTPPEPPADAPQPFNETAQNAYLCNEDTSARDFDSLWTEYQRTLSDNPLTGLLTALRPTCAGWSLPTQHFTLKHSQGSLQLSAHRHESSTPYPWAAEMRDKIGGTIFTVEDFVHGSLPFDPTCASHMTTYFTTGVPDAGSCPGIQPKPRPEPELAYNATTETAVQAS